MCNCYNGGVQFDVVTSTFTCSNILTEAASDVAVTENILNSWANICFKSATSNLVKT